MGYLAIALYSIGIFVLGLPIWIEVILFFIVFFGLPILSDLVIIGSWAFSLWKVLHMPFSWFTIVFCILFCVVVFSYIDHFMKAHK